MSDLERARIVVVADAEAAARAVAEAFVADAERAIGERGRFDVALAGGSTPKAAYALLASEVDRGRVDWERVRFFFGDERCVPPTDDASNYRMAYVTMLGVLGIHEAQIFRMRGEDEPPAAAAAYAKRVTGELGPDPVFDLVMLGMGPDGHTASWFPGTLPIGKPDDLVAAPYVPALTTHRLTLTPRLVNAARHVLIAATGDEKASALARALGDGSPPEETPIRLVRPDRGSVTWIVDRAAAAQTTYATG